MNINCAYFLSSDTKIIAATTNQQIILWDYNLEIKKLENNNNDNLIEKKTLIIIRDYQNEVLNALISQDEKYIFSYEYVKQMPKVYIWKKNEDNDDYTLIDDFIVESNTSSEAFANNTVVFVGYDSYIYKYNILNSEVKKTSEIKQIPESNQNPEQKINFEMNAEKIFISNNKKQFGKRIVLTAYSLDNKYLGKYYHNNISIYDVASGHGVKNVEIKKNPHALAFSSNNTEIAISTKDEVLIYDISKNQKKNVLLK